MICLTLTIALSTVALSEEEPAVAPAADPFAGNACVECHRDLPGRLSEIVTLEWGRSAHHAAGVGCEQCHGGEADLRRDQFESDDAWKEASHLQRDPELAFLVQSGDAFVSAARGRSVSYFCGKCHSDIKESHLGSPHGEFGDPTCLYCHGQGSHAIMPVTLDIIDTRGREESGRCSPCHLATSMATVDRIKALLEDTELQITASGEMYAELEGWGYRNLELEQLHHHAQQVRSKLRQKFHSFDMREINAAASEIQTTVDRTTATHEMISRLRSEQRRQAAIGTTVAFGLLVFAGLLVYYRHAFLEPHAATA
jgi:formate-dependent nitrite reductase cytochrome c552 subunit